ncbi:type VI secretion system baseplate subunit TssG [Pseudomonas sp. F1_0610]|uniref:type VI secretion system baseplate subunit TssG n=1 Tax=Pseudomonas sp. F1_0610 TaxID=3114284 RepID=UPI0039C1EB02
MEREPLPAPTELISALQDKITQVNFYRFCYLLEQAHGKNFSLGTSWNIKDDPIRFRPWPGMGFPASELKTLERSDQADIPDTLRVTFMGLYGVESPLPTAYIDDITQRREGYEVVAEFLDIFNHRLISQFYRVWRKYSWPATFRAGGSDVTSQYMLSLTGLGIPSCAKNIATPISRFLALTGMMRLPSRTAEGILNLVQLLAPNTTAKVAGHDPLRIPLKAPLRMSTQQPVSLASCPVMGSYGTDVNSQVLLTLTTSDTEECQAWLPGGRLHNDLIALFHVYVGARLHIRMQLKLARKDLPDATLSVKPQETSGQLGRTTVMRIQGENRHNKHDFITISLGRYQRLEENFNRRAADEHGDYRW